MNLWTHQICKSFASFLPVTAVWESKNRTRLNKPLAYHLPSSLYYPRLPLLIAFCVGNVEQWHGGKKADREEKASGEGSNYPEVELIVPNPLPSASVHIITVSVLLLTIHHTSAPLMECNKNQIPFASLHIQSMHIASKWVQMPSQKMFQLWPPLAICGIV